MECPLDAPRTNNFEGWHCRVKTLAGKADIATIAVVDETGTHAPSLRKLTWSPCKNDFIAIA